MKKSNKNIIKASQIITIVTLLVGILILSIGMTKKISEINESIASLTNRNSWTLFSTDFKLLVSTSKLAGISELNYYYVLSLSGFYIIICSIITVILCYSLVLILGNGQKYKSKKKKSKVKN